MQHSWKREWRLQGAEASSSLAALADVRCLALLGEAGIGKTNELLALHESFEREKQEFIWINGGEYGDETRLVGDIFKSLMFKEWLSGSGTLHLVIDGLDEIRDFIPQVDSILIGGLRKHRAHLERLRLRVTCRSTRWTEFFESEVRGLWGDDSAQVRTLLPLTADDIETAAIDLGVHPQKFSRAVARPDLLPLAARPITLLFLLGEAKKGAQLPTTRADLYSCGCLALCEEANQRRRDAGFVGSLSPKQRLAIAERVAAVLVFCAHVAVDIGPMRGGNDGRDIRMEGLLGGQERRGRQAIEVSQSALQEVLGVGLFDLLAPNRIGFAHRSFAEYLAAQYLLNHRMALARIQRLVLHPRGRQVVPQLRGVASWLATLDSGLSQDLQLVDAPVVLFGDIEGMRDFPVGALAQELLCQVRDGRCLQRTEVLRPHFAKLDRSDLNKPLRRWITGKQESFAARRMALQIAQDCPQEAPREALVDVALDSDEEIELRLEAVAALKNTADERTLRRLRPLALSPDDGDSADELKGEVLTVLWPRQLIKGPELFESLTIPKRPRLIGNYRTFLSRTLPQHLREDDMLPALRWVRRLGERDDAPRQLDEVRDGVVAVAVRHRGEEGVWKELIEVVAQVLLRGRTHASGMRGEMSLLSPDERRRLVAELVPRVGSDEGVIYALVNPLDLLAVGDFPWLLQRTVEEASSKSAQAWACLARLVFVWYGLEWCDALEAAARESAAVRDTFAAIVNQRVRRQDLEGVAPDRGRQAETHGADEEPVPSIEGILLALDELERGNSSAWLRLDRDLLEGYPRSAIGDWEPDLRQSRAWTEADGTARKRIVGAARTYVLEQDSEAIGGPTQHQYDQVESAGYRALYLLYHESPDDLVALPTDVWKRWAPIIVTYPGVSHRGSDELRLVKMAYDRARQSVVAALLAEIDDEAESPSVSCLRRVAECWDDELCRVLLERGQGGDLSPAWLRELWVQLIEHGCVDACRHVERLLSSSLAGRDREMAALMAEVLLVSAPDAGWHSVWPTMKENQDFGRPILVRLGRSGDGGRSLGQRLSIKQAGELLRWMTRAFPGMFSPEVPLDAASREADGVRGIRDALVARLVHSGSWEAVEFLERLGKKKACSGLNVWLPLATETALSCTWSPPSPEGLLTQVLEGGPSLTPTEEAEHARRGYKVRGPLRIAGNMDSMHRHVVQVSDDEVYLGDRTSELLLHLAAENSSGSEGWLAKQTLVDKKTLPDDADKGVKRLRDSLGSAGRELVESDGKGNIRLSIDPSFVEVDWLRLTRDPHAPIRCLAQWMVRGRKGPATRWPKMAPPRDDLRT